jgi:hypothetical protein
VVGVFNVLAAVLDREIADNLPAVLVALRVEIFEPFVNGNTISFRSFPTTSVRVVRFST